MPPPGAPPQPLAQHVMQAQPPSTQRTSQKLIRDMGDAVISVSLSDDGTLAAAGTTAARTVVFSVADNTELTSIQLKSGVNAVVFLGSGEYTTITVGTFNGFINTYFTCVPLSNGKTAPPDEREYTGVPFSPKGTFAPRGVLCMATACGGTRLVAGG